MAAPDRCIAGLIGRKLLAFIELEQLYLRRRSSLAIASARMLLRSHRFVAAPGLGAPLPWVQARAILQDALAAHRNAIPLLADAAAHEDAAALIQAILDGGNSVRRASASSMILFSVSDSSIDSQIASAACPAAPETVVRHAASAPLAKPWRQDAWPRS